MPRTTTGSDWGKADFAAIYDRPDPRAYFSVLQPLDYQVPHHGQAVFRMLTDALRRLPPDTSRSTSPQVLDLCCSYGVNAALLNHRLDLGDLYAHYTGLPGEDRLTAHQLADEDKAFYAEQRRPDAVRVVGLDAAPRAVGYARAVGLLDDGFAEDLETGAPTPALRDAVGGTDLITVTGGVGYIGAPTFDRLLDCMSAPPWVAAFVLRTVSYAPVAAVLERAGLVTEQVPGRTFRQRRFADGGEREGVFTALAGRGLDTEGLEEDGFYHADLYLSRPAADVAAVPLERLLPV
ncbi:hypothetical protein KGS77_06755 [Streptomyces sp. MST-110588]|nr:hypothetical protein KGS77_06755 [Streptomyces sp. MST-110588]